MKTTIIVEGRNDQTKLRKLLTSDVRVLATNGTLSHDRLEALIEAAGDDHICIFTDHDRSGRRIRAQLREVFPDAVQLYTKTDYAGVEGTPDEHLIQQLRKAELDEYLTPYALEKESLSIFE